MRTCIFGCVRTYGITLVALLAFTFAATASADENAAFRAAVDEAAAQYRVVLQVLETRGREETAAEVARFRKSWHTIIDRFGSKPPPAFTGDELYAATFTEIDTRVVGALIVISIGSREAARDALAPIGETLARLKSRSDPAHSAPSP